MKRINKNCVVFIICFLIIGIGYCSFDYVGTLKNALLHFWDNAKSVGVIQSAKEFTNEVDDSTTEYLSYHDRCVDLNSMYMRVLNTRIVQKDDETIVKMDNGMLAEEVSEISEDSIEQYTDHVKSLQDKTGIPVIYAMAPQKGFRGGLPTNADNYIKHNCDLFINSLEEKGIDYLDLRESMDSQNFAVEDSFFATDHHWKPSTGLWAANEIAKKLNSGYGFEYDPNLLDIDNYHIDTYPSCFLGSEGRKTGIYYTKFGLEDFDVMYPNYATNLTVTNPIEGTTRSGEFRKTVLNEEHLKYDTPYQSWLYSTYSDGDNAVQIIENSSMPDGKTVLVVRDSFAGVITPYLSLTCKTLHVLDLREDVVGTERVKSVSDYARIIKPDYILVIYKTVKTDECYQFN